MSERLAFVLCIEQNGIRPQGLLLIESIRRFAGKHRDADIVAICPRGLNVDRDTCKLLDALNVRYVELALNTFCPEYGSANRIYAGAWAAQNLSAANLVVLDSDTLFFGEPDTLGADFDFAARPVDVKNTSSTGPGDPLDRYLEALCGFVPVPIDVLPFITSTVDRARIRACYNGGYVSVRRSSGILERAAEIFTASVRLGLRPQLGRGLNILASTGWVGTVASEYWGSNQMALAVAAWSITRRVKELDERYNVPVHLLAGPHGTGPTTGGSMPPVHVHYHYMLTAGHCATTLKALKALGLSGDRLGWLNERIPLATI